MIYTCVALPPCRFLYWDLNAWENTKVSHKLIDGAKLTSPYISPDDWTPMQAEGPIDVGDGKLVYGGTDGPIGSIRLAAVRDGIEDFGYLALLKEAKGDAAVQDVIAKVATPGNLQQHIGGSPEELKLFMSQRASVAEVLQGSAAVAATGRGSNTTGWVKVGQGACRGNTTNATILDSFGCESGDAIATLASCELLCGQYGGCGGVTYGESWCELWVSAGTVLAPTPSLEACSDGYGGGWWHRPGGNSTLPVTSTDPLSGDPGDCYIRRLEGGGSYMN